MEYQINLIYLHRKKKDYGNDPRAGDQGPVRKMGGNQVPQKRNYKRDVETGANRGPHQKQTKILITITQYNQKAR